MEVTKTTEEVLETAENAPAETEEPVSESDSETNNPINPMCEVGTEKMPPLRYTEADVARIVTEVASHLSEGDPAARELENFRLREELAAEKKLRLLGENKLTCIRALEEAGVPVSFADVLVCEDCGEMERRISVFVSSVREWINREVSGKLQTVSPKLGGGETGITKAQFRAMRIVEQQEIYRNNRPLYEELSR